MKSTSFKNIMTLLLPLTVGLVLLLLADSVNAACCRIPGQGCNHYAVASCSPYPPCIGCVTPMDGIIKANTLEELLEVERAGKRNVKGSLKKGDNDELVKKTNVMNLGNTDEEGDLKKKAFAKKHYTGEDANAQVMEA